MHVCVPMYLNGAQFILLSGVIVHHHDKIVANVTLFVAAALVALLVWHQCGYVEYSCTQEGFINNKQTGCGNYMINHHHVTHSPCMMSSCQQ